MNVFRATGFSQKTGHYGTVPTANADPYPLLIRLLNRAEEIYSRIVIAIGAGSVVGWFNPYVLLALALTSFLLIFMILYPHINRARLVNQYRHWEKRNANKK